MLVRTSVENFGVSLFNSAANLMAVPCLHARCGDFESKRVGLKHPSIAPYGAFICADDRELVISIQNERGWANFCRTVLGDKSLPKEPRFCGRRYEHAEFWPVSKC